MHPWIQVAAKASHSRVRIRNTRRLRGRLSTSRQLTGDVTLCLRQPLHVECHRLDHSLEAGETLIAAGVDPRAQSLALALHTTQHPGAKNSTGESEGTKEDAGKRNELAEVH